ncbi:MAG: DUF4276 family protein [Planctomycetota bacterium]
MPIVEGHGEVDAVPELLTQWFRHRRFYNFDATKLAMRAPKSSMIAPFDPVRENGIELYVRRAAARRPDGIIVMLDSDDECRARVGRPPEQQLGPELLQRAVTEVGHIPIGVVVADREFEAWYLAAHMRFKAKGHFDPEVRFPANFNFEQPRDCKGRVSECIGRKYSETADQKELAKHIGFGSYMGRHCRSFAKLIRDLERVTQHARRNRRIELRRNRKQGTES